MSQIAKDSRSGEGEKKEETGLLVLAPPFLEVDGSMTQGRIELPIETVLEGEEGGYLCPLTESASLTMEIRRYPGFVRLRYRLGGSGARLTKSGGKDNFRYTSFAVPRGSRITELQINQYAAVRHAYLPQEVEHPEVAWTQETRIPGPILMAEWDSPGEEPRALLCAYEHGGEYADGFLGFFVQRREGAYVIGIDCGDGTYCDGTPFSDERPYVTPWFQIGLCRGDAAEMKRRFRSFLLRDMPDTGASREPYVFYNTWNNQERNRAFRGRRYLQDMNTGSMLEEVEIAHRMGIDTFVIDTGWYKSTGDWEVDLDRFPDDLRKIRSLLDRYGMRLGLWFNPCAAAVGSRVSREHPEYRKQVEGRDVSLGPIWETEESYAMCLASGYADWLAEKLVSVGERYGLSYFKWDAVDMRGCTAPHHDHGGPDVSPEERERNFRFQAGLALTRVASEVSRRIPGAIVDLDITESRRYVGLGFLSAGKFFHMNNGPYYHDFDIPNAKERYKDNWNVFFQPGAARSQVCRQSLAYDSVIPSILFLSHFLPEGLSRDRRNSLASLCLGGNGIWGDLRALSDEDIEEVASCLRRYKAVSRDVAESYPRVAGFIGASPEIHEKINPKTGRGLVAFFTREPMEVSYCTQSLEAITFVHGADDWEWLDGKRLRLTMRMSQDDARLVFLDGREAGA